MQTHTVQEISIDDIRQEVIKKYRRELAAKKSSKVFSKLQYTYIGIAVVVSWCAIHIWPTFLDGVAQYIRFVIAAFVINFILFAITAIVEIEYDLIGNWYYSNFNKKNTLPSDTELQKRINDYLTNQISLLENEYSEIQKVIDQGTINRKQFDHYKTLLTTQLEIYE